MAVTRIFSDVHFCDPASSVQDLKQLRPLLDGADQWIVNGDLLDTQVLDDAGPTVAAIRAFARAQVPAHLFITGNHDPDISDLHEHSLAGGAIWLTHGDVLYDDIAPWGHLAGEIRRRMRKHRAHLSPAEFARLETRFPVFRRVCVKLPHDYDPRARGPWARLMRTLRATFPPHRVLIMLKVWREMPGKAAALARAQRPEARVILMGHTHAPGAWERPDGRLVINTGTFCPPRKAYCVEVEEDEVRVREVDRRGGEFRLGETLRRQRVRPGAGVVQPC